MDEARENEKPDLPREEYEPVVAQTVELGFLGTEVALCVFDIHGDREIKTCHGDIRKIVDALRDYSMLLKMVCKTWNLQGFHRVKYEFYADKLREIADKFQTGIGYDYDAALERWQKATQRGCGRRGPCYGVSQSSAGGGGQGQKGRREGKRGNSRSN